MRYWKRLTLGLAMMLGGCGHTTVQGEDLPEPVLMRVEIEGVDLKGRNPMLRVRGWSMAPLGMVGRASWNVKLDERTRLSFYRSAERADRSALLVGGKCDIYAYPADALPYRFVASQVILDD